MRRTDHHSTLLDAQAGFGLVEVLFAVAVSAIGVLALAAVALGIGSQNRLSRWDTDGGLVARHALERVAAAGFPLAVNAAGSIAIGGRTVGFTQRATSISSRLKELALRVTSPGRSPATFVTRLAVARPLPVAP